MSDDDPPDQDGPIALITGVGALLLAAAALLADESLVVVVLAGAAGAVGLATWVFVLVDEFDDRFVVGGQASFAALSVLGGALALVWGHYLTGAGLVLVALMAGGRLFEFWRA